MMNDRNEDLNQPDEGDLLRDEVSDEAVEAAASVATGGLPTIRDEARRSFCLRVDQVRAL